jgi:hypothetical protein
MYKRRKARRSGWRRAGWRLGAGTNHGLSIRIITLAQDNRTSVLLIKRNASLAAAGPNLRSARDLIEAARRIAHHALEAPLVADVPSA